MTLDLETLTETSFLELLKGREAVLMYGNGGSQVSLLVHNAALVGFKGPLLDGPFKEAMSAIEVNVKSVLLACHAFGNHLRARGAAVIYDVI